MNASSSTTLLLRCVECGSDGLSKEAGGNWRCGKCGRSYPCHAHRGIPVLISSRSRLSAEEILRQQVVPQKANLKLAIEHWQTAGMQRLLEGFPGRQVLNYGCGDGGDRLWLESKGYDVTAFDIYPGDYTDFVCDGHELPFADHSFDSVVSLAVFEHLYDPHRAAHEMFRVLRDGGVACGAVAFLEPYHAESMFHMSPLGIREVLSAAGFKQIEIQRGWSWIEALSGSFWIWNQIRAVRLLTNKWQRAKFAFGQGLWSLAYRLKGRDVPERVRLGFCGSLVFRAVR